MRMPRPFIPKTWHNAASDPADQSDTLAAPSAACPKHRSNRVIRGVRLIAACRSSEWKAPRCNRRRVSVAKEPSTALAQEHEVGVKWNTHPGMPLELGMHLRMLVHGVVVEHRVDQFAGRDRGLDPV